MPLSYRFPAAEVSGAYDENKTPVASFVGVLSGAAKDLGVSSRLLQKFKNLTPISENTKRLGALVPALAEAVGKKITINKRSGLTAFQIENSYIQSASELSQKQYDRSFDLIEERFEFNKEHIEERQGLLQERLDAQYELNILDATRQYEQAMNNIRRQVSGLRSTIKKSKITGKYLHQMLGFNDRALAINLEAASFAKDQAENIYAPDSVYSSALVAGKAALDTAGYIGAKGIDAALQTMKTRAGVTQNLNESLSQGTKSYMVGLRSDSVVQSAVIDAFNKRAVSLNRVNKIYRDADVAATQADQKNFLNIKKARLEHQKVAAKTNKDIRINQEVALEASRQIELLNELANQWGDYFTQKTGLLGVIHGINTSLNENQTNKLLFDNQFLFESSADQLLSAFEDSELRLQRRSDHLNFSAPNTPAQQSPVNFGQDQGGTTIGINDFGSIIDNPLTREF